MYLMATQILSNLSVRKYQAEDHYVQGRSKPLCLQRTCQDRQKGGFKLKELMTTKMKNEALSSSQKLPFKHFQYQVHPHFRVFLYPIPPISPKCLTHI